MSSHCFVGNRAGKQSIFLRETPYDDLRQRRRQASPGEGGTVVIAFHSERESDQYFAAKARFNELAHELVEIAKGRIAADVGKEEAKKTARGTAMEILSAVDGQGGASSAIRLALVSEGEKSDGRSRMKLLLSEMLSVYAASLNSQGAFDSLFGHGMGKGFRAGHGERDVLWLVETLLSESKRTPRLAKVLEEVNKQQISIEEAGRSGGCGGA